jgi:Flp pilus assembly protein TadB
MAAITTAVVGTVAAAAAIGGTAYSVVSANKQRDEAKKQMEEQDSKQRGLEAEANKQNANRQALEQGTQAQQLARQRQKRQAVSGGRAGTILTSPLGLQSSGLASNSGAAPGAVPNNAGATKTLLGT